MNLKNLTLALLATAALATPALRADTRFSIGVNLGFPAYTPPPPMVVHTPAPAVVYAPPPVVGYAPANGYWEEVVVKTWVPERWTHTRDRWGRTVRVCEPAHYEFRNEKVWVAHRHTPTHRGYGTYGHWGR